MTTHNVLAYLRTSFSGRRPDQLEVQRQKVYGVLDERYGVGRYVVTELADHGGRPDPAQLPAQEELQRLLLLQEYDAVVVVAPSRLSRSISDLEHIENMINLCGAELIYVE